jgi:hypothetical protein
MYAVFCIPKNKNRDLDPPCLDPVDYGIDDEPMPHLLLRRGRVGLFETEEQAIAAARKTIEHPDTKNNGWKKSYQFQVIKCRLIND